MREANIQGALASGGWDSSALSRYSSVMTRLFMIFITCQKHYILLRDITKKNSGWQNTRLSRVVLVNIETRLKAAVLQTVKTGEKKSCVTPFYRVPGNKDWKRHRLTFLCRKTLPNVEYMYLCMRGALRDRQVHYHKTFFHFSPLLGNFLFNL